MSAAQQARRLAYGQRRSAMSVYTELRDQIDPDPPRALPTNVDAEQCLLGALLISNKEYPGVAAIVRADDFAWAIHQRIYAIITELIEAGKEANPPLMAHLFAGDPTYRRGYLMELARAAVTTRGARDYAIVVADCALRRDVIIDLEEPRALETAIEVIERHEPRLAAFRRARQLVVDG